MRINVSKLKIKAVSLNSEDKNINENEIFSCRFFFVFTYLSIFVTS